MPTCISSHRSAPTYTAPIEHVTPPVNNAAVLHPYNSPLPPLMLFSVNVVLHTHENKGTMNPNQFNPQFNPQGPPNNPQGPWQQQGQQPMGMPGPQHPQQPMPPGFPNPQQQQPGFPTPQQQQQQPSGLQSPRPQHPQGPPPFAGMGTPQLNGMYSPPAQPGGQAQQPMVQAQGQQGLPRFPLAEQSVMSPGPHRVVSTPGLVPQGMIPQAQQAQQGTPLPPSQQPTPRPPQTPLPNNPQAVQGGPPSVHSQHQSQHGTPARPVGAPGQFGPPPQVQLPMHGGPPGVQPQQQQPFGNVPMPMPMGPGHPAGLAQHPLHQGMPQMLPPMAQQSVHGGSPVPPPAQPGPPAGSRAPSVRNAQAAGASAQQAQPMHVRGADLQHDHIEAYNERFSDLRVKEVMKATAEHQDNYYDPPEEMDSALEDSLKIYEEHQLKNFAKERDQIHAAVKENLFQGGGGSKRGAGKAAPKAKCDSRAGSTKSKKNSEGNDPMVNDPPSAPHISFAPSKREQSQTPVANNVPDEETANVSHGKQPATPDVNLERSRSPSRSPSRPRRHGRRRDAEWEGWSSRSRRGAQRWRNAGMYYSSGAYKGGILDSARPRHRRADSQP
jgi:hypothetical protein